MRVEICSLDKISLRICVFACRHVRPCFAVGRELAFRKPTTQSSTLRHNTGAKEANDGSLADNDVSHCSMTRLTDEPWWLVDLEQTYSIQRVVIHNMALTETQGTGANR